MSINTRIQTKRDTAANWETNNSVLLDGELIIVTTNAGDTRFKIGDGTKTYTQLPFQDESLYNALSGKADSDDVNTALATKADSADLEAVQTDLDSKRDLTNNTFDSITTSGQVTVTNGTTSMELYVNGLGSTTGNVWIDQAGDAYFGEVYVGSNDVYERLLPPLIVTANSTDGVTYTATVDGMDSLTVGKEIVIVPDYTSTSTAPTLNVNGLGAKTIRCPVTTNNTTTSAAANASWLYSGKPVRVIWNGSFWVTDIPRVDANTLYNAVPIDKGGTGATDAETALTNLGAISCPFHVGTSAPSNTNLLWIDTANGLKYYNGSAWVIVPVAYS